MDTINQFKKSTGLQSMTILFDSRRERLLLLPLNLSSSQNQKSVNVFALHERHITLL